MVVERLWGVLENHWRGEIIDTTRKGLGLARSMTYRGLKPTARKVTKVNRAGISVATKAMREIEKRLERKPGLESWLIRVVPQPQMGQSFLAAALVWRDTSDAGDPTVRDRKEACENAMHGPITICHEAGNGGYIESP